jgi:hypothetical protein
MLDMESRPPESGVFEDDFALGWRVAFLYHLPAAAEPASDAGSVLPDERRLKAGRRAKLLTAQIKGGIQNVSRSPGWPEGRVPDVGPLEELVESLPHDSAIRSDHAKTLQHRLVELNAQLVDGLAVVDFRRGKAYGVGTQLAETVLIPSAHGLDDEAVRRKLRAAFEDERIYKLRGDLKDLKTRLPKFVADAVSASLSDWGKWVRPNSEKQLRFAELRPTLYRQGQLWRALLSGEKDPRDMLQVPDYVKAGSDLASRIRKLGMAAVGHFLGAIIAVLSVAALALFLVTFFVHNVPNVLNGLLLTLLGALGLSAASATAALRRAVAAVGDSLWDAELAASVAAAIYLGPLPVDNSSIEKLRKRSLKPARKLSRSAAAPRLDVGKIAAPFTRRSPG